MTATFLARRSPGAALRSSPCRSAQRATRRRTRVQPGPGVTRRPSVSTAWPRSRGSEHCLAPSSAGVPRARPGGLGLTRRVESSRPDLDCRVKNCGPSSFAHRAAAEKRQAAAVVAGWRMSGTCRDRRLGSPPAAWSCSRVTERVGRAARGTGDGYRGGSSGFASKATGVRSKPNSKPQARGRKRHAAARTPCDGGSLLASVPRVVSSDLARRCPPQPSTDIVRPRIRVRCALARSVEDPGRGIRIRM